MMVNKRITWEASRDVRNAISIFVDGEFWKEVHAPIFKKKLSFPKSIRTFEELNDCFFSLEVKCAKDFVLMKLTRKSYYSKEIEKMLKDAFVSQEAIHVVIEKCTMYGFINDALWIQSFIRKEQMLKHGRRLIANKLRQKYVPEENIIAFLNSGTASEQREQILKLLQTKYKARNLADFKEREKTVGAIMRRGYTYTEIKESIESLGYSGEEGCNL